MNRTIKFRAKSIHSNDWCYGSLVQTTDNKEIQGFDIFGDGNSEWQEEVVEEDTIGQFTGLCDKNGKEIYEDDILKVSLGHPDFDQMGIVSYDIYARFTITPTDCTQGYLYFTDIVECKVIGNIHDNKGLIETNEE